MVDGRIVWDSDKGSVSDEPPSKKGPPVGDGIARVRRETGGRGGKTVTTISGIAVSTEELASLAKTLKRQCGVGGSVRDWVIELQGDQRDRVVEFLEGRGYAVLRAGG